MLRVYDDTDHDRLDVTVTLECTNPHSGQAANIDFTVDTGSSATMITISELSKLRLSISGSGKYTGLGGTFKLSQYTMYIKEPDTGKKVLVSSVILGTRNLLGTGFLRHFDLHLTGDGSKQNATWTTGSIKRMPMVLGARAHSD